MRTRFFNCGSSLNLFPSAPVTVPQTHNSVIPFTPDTYLLWYYAAQNSPQFLIVKYSHIRQSSNEGIQKNTSIAPLILNLDARWRWVVNYTLRPLPPPPHGNEIRYPLNRRLGGPQSGSGRFGEHKNPLPLPVHKPWSSSPSPSYQTDAILTSAYFNMIVTGWLEWDGM
jgi:hypothetical protein